MATGNQQMYPVPPSTGSSEAAIASADSYRIYPRRAGSNFGAVGLLSASVGLFGTSSTIEYFAGRIFYKIQAANTTNGTTFGGFGGAAIDTFHLASAACKWTAVYTFKTPAALTYVGNAWIGFSANTLTDVAPASTPNDTIAVHWTSTGVLTLCTKATGAISQAVVTGTLAAGTMYALEVKWDGTTAYARLATIDATTGVIGTYGASASLATNPPTSTTFLFPQMRSYQGNGPPAAQSMHYGLMECRLAA